MARVTRRGACGGLALAALGIASARDASGQAETGEAMLRNARLLVGFPPGGSTDVIARLLVEQLRGRYAATMVVENRPGAAGRLAVEAARGAAPDGTTMVLTPNATMTIFPHAYPRTTRYDALADFAPVSTVCSTGFGLAVPSGHPAGDLPGFLDWARAQPVVHYATPAAGTQAHFMMFNWGRAQRLPLEHVTYRGMTPALQDLMMARIPLLFGVMADLMPQLQAGTVRALAISSPRRSPRLPDVPTFAELDHPEMAREGWWGVFLPTATPAALVSRLHEAIVGAVAAPAFRASLDALELTAASTTPAALVEAILVERDAWGPVVRVSGFDGDG